MSMCVCLCLCRVYPSVMCLSAVCPWCAYVMFEYVYLCLCMCLYKPVFVPTCVHVSVVYLCLCVRLCLFMSVLLKLDPGDLTCSKVWVLPLSCISCLRPLPAIFSTITVGRRRRPNGYLTQD